MADSKESELFKLFKKSENEKDLHLIEATVDTGLEWQAVDECKERIDTSLHVLKERGKIYFNLNLTDFPKVQEMRSIDNIFIVGEVHRFAFSENKKDRETDLNSVKDYFVENTRLIKSLDAWKAVTKFPGKVYPTLQEYEEADSRRKIEKEQKPEEPATVASDTRGRKRGCDPSLAAADDVLKYRVTCERNGKHSFESGQVARVIGGELQDKFNWLVDLTTYHLEVVCNVIENELVTCFRVTHESKHRRNIAHFGPTTLRATVCYSLIRLANPRPGEIIIDPMCGGGSIPIEASIAFPGTYVLGGDNHEKAVDRSKLNFDAGAAQKKIDLVRWTLTQLPMKDSCVDVVVTDMPFGKRSGSMTDNRVLYKKYIVELARIVKAKSGRLVLLTYDRRSIQLALEMTRNLFKVIKMLGVNMGGLHAAVYVLRRTGAPYPPQRASYPEVATPTTG